MALRYFVNGGVDNNWGTIGNWSLTDGGSGGQSVPGSSDDVFFTSNSPACTVNSSSRNAKSLDFTGYSNTITMSNAITVAGNVTLSATMGIAGAAGISVSTTATLTSNGRTWTQPLTLATGGITYTLADNWSVSGSLTLGATTSTVTINGFQLTASGNVTFSTTSGSLTGTTTLLLNGSGAITAAQTTGSVRLTITINTASTYTLLNGSGGGATLGYGGGTLTYTAGTINASSSTLILTGANCTLAIGGMTWGTVNFSGAITTTLSEDVFAISGLFGSAANAVTVNGSSIYLVTALTYNGTTGAITGTSLVIITDRRTITLSAPSFTTGRFMLPIRIDNAGGTVTVSGSLPVDFYNLDYRGGNVVVNGNTWVTRGGGLIGGF